MGFGTPDANASGVSSITVFNLPMILPCQQNHSGMAIETAVTRFVKTEKTPSRSCVRENRIRERGERGLMTCVVPDAGFLC